MTMMEQETEREAIPGHVIHIPPGVLNQEHLPDLVRYIEGQVGTSVQVATLHPRTPPWLFDKLDGEFGFTVDVCASDWNAKCKKYWTKEQDGQQQDWSNEICWMNPPYGQDLGGWIHKAYSESLKGATVVCLVPVSPDRSWWHDYVIKGKSELRWIRQTTVAPFPRCVVIFRPPKKRKRWKNEKALRKTRYRETGEHVIRDTRIATNECQSQLSCMLQLPWV